MKLLDKHSELNRPLILDGAIGSYFQKSGYVQNDLLWSTRILIEQPERLSELHNMYLHAGCDILTTNTFRTNPHMLGLSGYSESKCKEFVFSAVELARRVIDNQKIILAGSNPPAEDCYQTGRTISRKELRHNHQRHIEFLLEAGVDIIWNETQSHLDEIELVCEICSELRCEFTLNLYLTSDGQILSGETFQEIVAFISNYSPASIGINCINLDTFEKIVSNNILPKNWGFYLNCLSSPTSKNQNDQEIPSGRYAEIIRPYLELNPLYIGSCCGSTPEYTKRIKETVLEFYKS